MDITPNLSTILEGVGRMNVILIDPHTPIFARQSSSEIIKNNDSESITKHNKYES